MNSWLIMACLSAFFAAVVSILAKIGIKDMSSNLATAVRTVVVLVFAWAVVWWEGSAKELGTISKVPFIFLVLSGLATGLSWLFYFRALQIGEASKVAPIDKLSLVLTVIFATLFLGEKMTTLKFLGALLMSVGAIMVSFAK